jgi:predicted PurR-regulated permease PerM
MIAPPFDWTFRRVVWATLVLGSVALGFWLLYRFNQVVFILVIAILIGTVIRPAVAWLHRRGLSRIAGVIVVYLLLLALLIGFVLLLFPLIVDQGTTIAGAVPGYYSSLREWMANSPNQLILRLSEYLPASLPSLGPARPTGTEVLSTAEQALGYAALAAKAVFLVIVILVLAFHWTIDGPQNVRSLLLLLPRDKRATARELVGSMESKVGAYIIGQGVLCLVIGAMALVAYLIIGLPNALVLALLAGLLEAVPMIGPLLGAIPAAMVALSIGPEKMVLVIIATVIIQQLENSLLVPRVMRKAVGVNPFVSLLAVFAFGSLFGIPGVLMAIPIAAIIQLMFSRFVFDPEAAEPEVAAGRDLTSRLRYETQDLVQDLRKHSRRRRGGSDLHIEQTDQIMEEIEAIAADLDSLLAESAGSEAP